MANLPPPIFNKNSMNPNIHNEISQDSIDNYKPDSVQLVPDIMLDIQDEISNRQQPKMLYATGFPSLDILTAGFQLGDLFVLAGKPSSGKSSWAAQTALYQAVEHLTPVLFCSYEMSSSAIVSRMLASEMDISYQYLTREIFNQEQKNRLSEAVNVFQGIPFWITDNGHNVNKLKSLIVDMKNKFDIKLVYIDFLTIIPADRKYNSDYEKVSETVREIKRIAKTNDICIILLSQLSRASERRTNSRLVMSDLRATGEIEQVADVIVFLDRQEEYDDQTTLILAKQRNGAIGDIALRMNGKRFRFEEI